VVDYDVLCRVDPNINHPSDYPIPESTQKEIDEIGGEVLGSVGIEPVAIISIPQNRREELEGIDGILGVAVSKFVDEDPE